MNVIWSLCRKYTDLSDEEIRIIEHMSETLQPLANLEGADIFIDCPGRDGNAIVVAEAKPECVPSSYKNTVVGLLAKPENEPAVARTFRLGVGTKQMKAVTQENGSTIQSVEPIRNGSHIIGVLILEKRVDDIMENISIGGRYDENIQELDNNIYILTELIQDNIQYYIYYQTKSMEAVTTDLNRQIHNFVIACGLLVLVLLILTVMVTYLITADILRPINVLYDATRRVSQGELSARADVSSGDEIEILARSFNDMAGNMQQLVQKTKEDEQKLRRLDLRLLQEQINPHFLYNTLDTIVWLIEGDQADEAVGMVVTLSNFFRLVLSRGREFISLREEEQHIRSYLEIQEVRYHDILEYDIQIDPALYDYQILKLTLQPLVENALYHGIKYKRAKGCIRVRGEKAGEVLRLTVGDNGVGMDESDLEQLRREIGRPCRETEKGFGLANVNERIHMYFGPEYGMDIRSEKGGGTVVTLTIPAVKAKDNPPGAGER